MGRVARGDPSWLWMTVRGPAAMRISHSDQTWRSADPFYATVRFHGTASQGMQMYYFGQRGLLFFFRGVLCGACGHVLATQSWAKGYCVSFSKGAFCSRWPQLGQLARSNPILFLLPQRRVETLPDTAPTLAISTHLLPALHRRPMVQAQSRSLPGSLATHRSSPTIAGRAARLLWVIAVSICARTTLAASPSPSQSPFPQSGLLFPLADTWRVLDANSNLAGATTSPRWVDLTYNDAAWTVGNGSLGFGFVGNGEKTTLKVWYPSIGFLRMLLQG